MLIPLRHENMEGRRWPVVTFTLIALNVLIFLGTHWKIMEETQDPARREVRAHLILLAVMHPELNMSSQVQELIKEVQRRAPAQVWKELAAPKRPFEDHWDEQIRGVEDPRQLQSEMEYSNAGGDRMPAGTWLELCRIVEGQENYERAMSEYERLARAYPTERQSLLALLSAGRLALKQLNRPADALRYYRTAKVSTVPHLDWEANIQTGIQAAEKAAGVSISPA
ncbi:MAG TPA: hypothetical protein VEW05_01690 [Candidatus Polarisedimenticolia bacterium]|nr:hypothetical protein [Candidatus Polarisedimenticolia bacterium]